MILPQRCFPFRPWLAALAFAAASIVEASAQEPTQVPQEPQKQAQQPTAEEQVEKLGSETFRERQQAERALRAMGKDALPALRKAADGDADDEAQWRARRLIRQIEGDGDVLAPREPIAPQGETDRATRRRVRPFLGQPEDVQQRFDDLFRSLESDFGMDIPRARFFDDSFFRDLQQQMDDMQQRLHGAPFGEGRSMSMQMGPDGVRVEVKTKSDKGEEETKVYEAPDMETFRDKYPGVLDGSGFGGGFTFTMPNGGLRGFAQGMPQIRGLAPRAPARQQAPVATIDSLPPSHKRLGVTIRDSVSADLLEHLGLAGALGVQDVQPGTLAESLGIQSGDLVARIAGKEIADTQDVQDALGPIEAGQEVEVVVYRRGAALTLRAKKPDAKQAEVVTPLQKREKGGDQEPSGDGKR